MTDSVNDYLEEVHFKSYEREIDENESVWRSLPMFVVAFGFAVTLLGYVGSRVPLLAVDGRTVLTLISLGLPAGAFAWAFGWFWQVVKPRTYRYLTPDNKLRDFAGELRSYYDQLDQPLADIEQELLKDIKSYVRNELAEAATQNQEHNQAKSRARSQVAFWLTAGFALAFAATVLTFFDEKLYGIQSSLERQNVNETVKTLSASGTRPSETSSTSSLTSSSAVHRGGGRSPIQGRQKAMTDGKAEPAKTTSVIPQIAKPTPPPPTMVKSSVDKPKSR